MVLGGSRPHSLLLHLVSLGKPRELHSPTTTWTHGVAQPTNQAASSWPEALALGTGTSQEPGRDYRTAQKTQESWEGLLQVLGWV